MTELNQNAAENGRVFPAIVYALFRHKGKVLLCTLLGFTLAVTFYIYRKPIYQSEAKLLVRYVLERSAIDSINSQDGGVGSGYSDSVINSEVEILTSWDLAKEAADAVGVERLSPGLHGPTALDDATLGISKGVVVNTRKGSSVIGVTFSHTNPEIATSVLRELVSRYFAKHLEVHRSTDAFDFVSQQTKQVRERLRQTEEELKQLKSKEGIISLGDSATRFTTQLAKSQSELLVAEAELAEQTARVNEIEKWIRGASDRLQDEMPNGRKPQVTVPSFSPSPDSKEDVHSRGIAGKEPTSSDIQKYQALIERLATLRQSELELLSKYTPGNELVKSGQAELQSLDSQRRQMEEDFPSLLVLQAGKGLQSQLSQPDIVTERARLAAIEAKVDTLKLQAKNTLEASKTFAELGMQITQLERRKEIEEANYKYFESSLEKARIDEALDPSKIPNISVVQKPTTAIRITGKSKKIILSLVAGGLAMGIGIALLIEYLIDRSVKRASEIEIDLGMPLLRTVPLVAPTLHTKESLQDVSETPYSLQQRAFEEKPHNGSLLWKVGHPVRSYCEEIRDRIILYFDFNRLTHKPKLVAVTGCDAGAGASTIAAGLAASLSETGAGKVLLVDMNIQQAELHPYFDGIPACALSEAIDPGKQIVSASQNLYLATALCAHDSKKNLKPRRFSELFPSLKASNFDYIIFDMPPTNTSTTTLAMAGMMDKVLLVIEAEKTRRESLHRTYFELKSVKANVSGVFNKANSYLPKWLGYAD